MDNSLKINVKLNENDIKNLTFARLYTKARIILSVVINIIIIGIFVSTTYQKINYIASGLIIILVFSMLLACIAFDFINFKIRSSREISNFNKSNILGNLNVYEFINSMIKISSSNGSFSVVWSDVYKVQELKPCFLIFVSPCKCYVIPKRCFNSKQQINEFLGMVASKVNSKKLNFKNYKTENFSPDYAGNAEIQEEALQEDESDSSEAPLFEFCFSYNTNEMLKISYRMLYTNPAIIIVTIMGILGLISFISNFNNSISFEYGSSGILFFSLSMTVAAFLIPISIYLGVKRQYNNDKALNKIFRYKIYSDYFIIMHPSGNTKLNWNKLIKITKNKSAFIFYTTTKMAYIIPKSAFRDNNDEYERFEKFILKKRCQINDNAKHIK